MTLQDIHKEFDKEFNMGINGNRENEFGTIQGFDEASVKDFYDKKIVEAIEENTKEIIDVIEEYFIGLIHIPEPQLTKRFLIMKILKARNINLD